MTVTRTLSAAGQQRPAVVTMGFPARPAALQVFALLRQGGLAGSQSLA